jgi:hypothetical protein
MSADRPAVRTSTVPRLGSVLTAAASGVVLCMAALVPARAQRADQAAQSGQADLFRLPDAATVFAPPRYDPRNPAGFRRPAPVAQAGGASGGAGDITVYGNPPASGAGDTGFDSSNSLRRKARGAIKRKPGVSLPLPPPPGVVPGPVSPTVATRPTAQDARRGAAALPAPAATLVPEIATPSRRKLAVEADPFAPTGVQAGAFMLFPAIEFSGGYDTNPQHIPGEKASAFAIVAPELKVRSDWERHALNADIKASYIDYFQSFPPTITDSPSGIIVSGPPESISRPSVDSKIDGRIDVTSRNHLDLEGRLLVGTDNPGSPNIQADLARLPIVTTLGATLGYTHSFNRLEITAKGTFDRSVWQASTLTDGTTSSNDDRNFDQYGGALRGSYELKPGIRPFVEVGADTRQHDLALDRNGEDRNSTGEYAKVGTTFEITRKLTGELALGYLARQYTGLPDLAGPTFDASLVFAATPLTTFKVTAVSTVNEVIVPGASGDLSHNVALQVDHAFRRWLIGTAKIGFGIDDYVGFSRLDHTWFASLGVIYKLNRDIWLKGELRRDWLASSAPGVDYTADQFMLGIRLQH